MCLGLASGYRIKDGDRYVLHYLGRDFPYVAKDTPNGMFLVHDSQTPLGTPLTAISINNINEFDFRVAGIKSEE